MFLKFRPIHRVKLLTGLPSCGVERFYDVRDYILVVHFTAAEKWREIRKKNAEECALLWEAGDRQLLCTGFKLMFLKQTESVLESVCTLLQREIEVFSSHICRLHSDSIHHQTTFTCSNWTFSTKNHETTLKTDLQEIHETVSLRVYIEVILGFRTKD